MMDQSKEKKSKIKKLNKEYDVSCLNIRSKKMCQDLKTLGITENKSLTLSNFSVPYEFEMNFLLGVFDGDGSIGPIGDKNFRIRFVSASLNFINYLRTIMERNGFGEIKINTRKENRQNPLYTIECSTQKAYLFYQKTYQNNSIYLKRKYNKFQELISKRRKFQELSTKKLKLYI